MGREVVTGYCWPQSVGAGEQIGLHMSSSAGRPVRVEVARVGARREVVFSSDAVAADEHETPEDASSEGCGWPVALTLDVDPTWRSGYYEVVMEIDVGEKVRRVSCLGGSVVFPLLGSRGRRREFLHDVILGHLLDIRVCSKGGICLPPASHCA